MSGSGFQPRDVATIRASLLNDIQSRYAALNPPRQISIAPGSDAYMKADALAVELLLLENQAAAQISNAFPDTADPDALAHHGTIEGVARKLATPWVGTITITGNGTSTITFGTATLNFNGLAYGSFADAVTGAPVTSVTLVGGSATIRATAQQSGSDTDLPTGTILQWSSPPANANSTATVASTVTEGTDDEALADWSKRIISRLQERPASGNRADWCDWVGQFKGVQEAYAYPLLIPQSGTPSYLTGVPGTITLVPLGPAQGDVPGLSGRQIAGPTCVEIENFVDGTGDDQGNAVATGVQLRPVTLPQGNFTVQPCGLQALAVALTVTVSRTGPYAPAWSGSATVTAVAGSAGAGWVLTVNAIPAGIGAGSLVAFPCTTASKRGGYDVASVLLVNFGTNQITLSPNGNTTEVPDTSGATPLLPACQGWKGIQAAVFAYFDALGPGDILSTDDTASARWPTQDQRGRATLSTSILASRVIDAFAGALSASVTTPAADVTPAAMACLVLTTLQINFSTV